ncbi:MAG: diaminopimelate dehydrogenase [Clostridia bacterium]|nr:diaminopimelate dehydrogenase [Clostridia bacterium]
MSIKIGILGYGNLGKGVEKVIKYNEDMELVAIFTRREPSQIVTKSNVKVISIDEIEAWKDKIDVMILCGGSSTDLPIQTPEFAKIFNVVDSFDTHAKILEHYKNVDKSAKEGGKVALISCGWDPGAFSLNRLMSESFLPNGNTYTFWGTGVSQGHSDAIRRIEGVKNAVQYTVPIDEAIVKVRNGENPELATNEKHLRKCYVVLEEGADPKKIEEEIKTMPNYFAEYNTEVYFITEEELINKHSGMPHGGFVIRSGITDEEIETNQIIEYSLKLDSNPEFTASVLLAYARAVYRLAEKNDIGAKTVFDIAPSLLSKKSNEELLGNIL